LVISGSLLILQIRLLLLLVGFGFRLRLLAVREGIFVIRSI
jgi:hypothetical protein